MINYTARVGMESEAHLCWVAQRLGWELARPYSNNDSHDFAVRLPGRKRHAKVQVKTSAPKRANAGPSVDIRKNGNKPYKDSDYDYLYAYDPATLKAWLIPKKKLSGVACEFSPDMPQWNKYEVHY
jgi:hypothetical protein